MIRTIALNRLLPSPRNVRRASDEAADLELKADIEAHGLLQNLVVTSLRKPRGSFAVEAGGRRLRALKSLADDGKLAASHEVCCLVIEGGGAAAEEASLAENFQRLSMNPADECLAFGRLVEQGGDAEAIARRFGLTVRFVEGRLRLAQARAGGVRGARSRRDHARHGQGLCGDARPGAAGLCVRATAGQLFRRPSRQHPAE
jgi:ParB family chromosome partitioning protein